MILYFSISIKHPYDVTPQAKMPQCRKQAGTKDCSVYATVFATAIAFGKYPGRQNLKQDEMDMHCYYCSRHIHLLEIMKLLLMKLYD